MLSDGDLLGFFHPALNTKIASLSIHENNDIVTALDNLQTAGSKSQMILCMKKVLLKFGDQLDDGHQLSQNQIEVLSELIFIPDSIHLHQVYISFVRSLPREVREAVEECWVERIFASQDANEYPCLLEGIQSIQKSPLFDVTMRKVALEVVNIVTRVLEFVHGCVGIGDIEHAHRKCTMAATVGYIVISTYGDSIIAAGSAIDSLSACCRVAGRVMKKQEFCSVEITLSMLIYSILVIMESDQNVAMVTVLACILGESSSCLNSIVQELDCTSCANASDFQDFDFDLSDRHKLLFLRTISQSLVDALAKCEGCSLLEAFKDIFGKVCSAYRADSWSKVYFMESMTSVLKEAHRKTANGADKSKAFFDLVPVELEEFALWIALGNLHDDEVIVIRSAQTLLQDILNLDKVRSSTLGRPPATVRLALQHCSSLGIYEKAKYRMLHCLEKYITACEVLEENPTFIQDTVQAIAADRAIKGLASSALAFVWKQLYFNHQDDFKGGVHFLGKDETMKALSWIVNAMVGTEISLQYSVSLYVLPGLVKNCPKSFYPVLERLIRVRGKHESWLSSCLSLLSIGRKEAVYSSIKVLETEGISIYEILEEALLNESNAVQISAVELLVTSSKTIDVPNKQELHLLWKYFNMAMRCTATSSRQDIIAAFGQFLKRVKVSVAATLTRPGDFSEEVHADVQLSEVWFRRFCSLCLSCMHPGGVYGKKYMGGELLWMTLEAFSVLIAPVHGQTIPKRNAPYMSMFQDKDAGQGLKYGSFRPFPEELFRAETTDMLFTTLLDAWDRISDVSASILLMLPAPFPGIETPDSVSQILKYSLKMLNSPRLIEADSGAKIIMIVYMKYVSECQWSIRVDSDLSCTITQEHNIEKYSIELQFVEDILNLCDFAFLEAVRHLEKASKNGIAHGYLMALRYICPYMTVTSAVHVNGFINRVDNLLRRGYEIVIPLLASPEENLVGVEDDKEVSPDMLKSKGPGEHFVYSAAWITSKEICRLIECMWIFCDRLDLMKVYRRVLENMAELLLEILLQAKHSGTIDNARAALQFACGKSIDWGQSKLSESLIDHLFSQMMREEQSRRDAIRRSGGLPFAINAVVVPHAKSYLPVMAMKRLLNVMQIDTRHKRDIFWPKVHALNTLRLMYSDGKLSMLETFYGDGFKVILVSFSDPSWEIRNAASLCFASLVSRVMGFSNIQHREHVKQWPKRSPTACQFFEKYESVHQYILEALECINAGVEAVDSCYAFELLPLILGMLCRLRPTVSMNEHLSAKIRRYGDALRNCSGSRQVAIRKFAARAFASVIPSSEWSVWSEELSSSLAQGLSCKKVNWNKTHGQILILIEILQTLYSLSKQEEHIDHALFQNIGQSIQGNMQVACLEKTTFCPPVVADFLKLCILLARINTSLGFDEEIFEFYGERVLNTFWPAFMGEDAKGCDQSPGASTIRKRLSKLKFMWKFPILYELHDPKKVCRMYAREVHEMLQCPTYEVREAVLKCFLAQFETIIVPHIASDAPLQQELCRLYNDLREAWAREGAFCARIFMLQTVNMMHTHLLESCGVHFSLKEKLVERYKTQDGKNPAILQELIIYSMHDALYHKSQDTVTFALDMIQTYSHPWHPENVRRACAQSIAMSGLLNPYTYHSSTSISNGSDIGSYVGINQYMEFWQIVLMLLEDEEPGIRTVVSASVQRIMFSRSIQKSDEHSSIRVEVVQERILPWLAAALSPYPSFVSYLQSWICIPADCHENLHQALDTQDDATIFKEETANQHTDPLILVNLASKQLVQMATTDALSKEQQDLMQSWSSKAMDVLCNFARSYRGMQGTVHQDLIPAIYEDVYRLLAACWTAAHMMNDTKPTDTITSSISDDTGDLVTRVFSLPAMAGMISALSGGSTDNTHKSPFEISARWQIV